MFLSPYFLYSDLHLLHNKQRKSRPSVEKYKIQIASIWIRESMAKTSAFFKHCRKMHVTPQGVCDACKPTPRFRAVRNSWKHFLLYDFTAAHLL